MPSSAKASTALPTDVLEAFASDSAEPLRLTDKDLRHFKGCVDRKGENWQTPPPSPRFLQLVRRMKLTKRKWANGKRVDELVVLLDVSQLPAAWFKPLDEHGIMIPILVHTKDLMEDVLTRMKVKRLTTSMTGACVAYSIHPTSVAKVMRLVDAHAAFIGDRPAFLGKPAGKWGPYAEHGLKTYAQERR